MASSISEQAIPFHSPIHLTPVASTYWTGLMGDWTSNPNDRCLGWTLPDYGPTLGAYGLGDQTNSSSIGGTDFCNAVRRLVCVQQ